MGNSESSSISEKVNESFEIVPDFPTDSQSTSREGPSDPEDFLIDVETVSDTVTTGADSLLPNSPPASVNLSLSSNVKSLLPVNENAKFLATGFTFHDDQFWLNGKNGRFVSKGALSNRVSRSERKKRLSQLRNDEDYQKKSEEAKEKIKMLMKEELGHDIDPLEKYYVIFEDEKK